jgi:hypothetical protein
MDEEPGGNAVPCRPQATPPLLAASEIDLGRILRHDNPASGAGGDGTARERLHDLDCCDGGCCQKPVERHLAGPITAKFAGNQRPGFHHPLNQRGAHRRATGIPKIAKLPTLMPHVAP